MNLRGEIRGWFRGEIADEKETREQYNHDASIFEVEPELVLTPTDAEDIKELVSFVREKKASDATLSITPRAAGTCMSGGSLTSSILIDLTRHMNRVGHVEGNAITVEPGAYYRVMEEKTKAHGLILPCYTASKDFCAVGGMVANNSGGEKSLIYGNTERYILKLRVVLSDGHEYEFRKLTRDELEKKKKQDSFEGQLYRNISSLIEKNHDLLLQAKPTVSKNSAGYLLWNVWDAHADTFDLTRLFAGSQGTLGIITSITFQLVPDTKHSALLVLTLPSLTLLPTTIEKVLIHGPESFESYDDATFRLAEKYMPEAAHAVLTKSETPITLMAQFAGNTEDEAWATAKGAQSELDAGGITSRIVQTAAEAESYWSIRRASFKLLREHTDGSHRVAPFIDDIIVPTGALAEFIPKLREILTRYDFTYTLAGHIGSGNFHLIPLVDMSAEKGRGKIIPLAREVFKLVFSFGGSMAGEHNDGIIRTPFLEEMYGSEIVTLFQKTKNIFDPQNIFNPGKKVGGTLDYAIDHFAKTNASKDL